MQASGNGTALESWKVGTEPCSRQTRYGTEEYAGWAAVRCKCGVVVALGNYTGCSNINDPSINGTIVPAICELAALWKLDFSYTRVSGTIPHCLGSLANLAGMDLSGTKLSGTIPSSLGDPTKSSLFLGEYEISPL